MARVIEETITIKLSKIIRDSDKNTEMVTDEQMQLIIATVPSVIDEVLNDNKIIVEVDSE
jgi:hypothetical protein